MSGHYVHSLDPFLFRFNEQIGLRWYGLAYVAAFFVSYLLCRQFARKGYLDLKPSDVGDFITGCAIFGVLIGGRVGYIVFYGWDSFVRDPLMIFRVWDGGMSAHGGILGVMLYTFWYSWRHKVAWLNVGDNLVVTVPVGLFFGRVANFINGELFGRVTDVSWAIQFPKELYDAPPAEVESAIAAASSINPSWTTVEAVIENARQSPELRGKLSELLAPRHPSQLYEAALEGVLLFAILWILRTRFRLPNGVLTGVFFLGYAILRSVSEFFREPDAPLTGALTRGQFLSVFLVLIAAGFFAVAILRPRYPRNG